MNYKYFIHQDCSFYPCHDLAEWKSCLFCWRPLYLLDCGGDFVLKNKIKTVPTVLFRTRLISYGCGCAGDLLCPAHPTIFLLRITYFLPQSKKTA